MPLSFIQKGAIGQFIFLATALFTGRGQVEVYTPAIDNEGRDAEVRRHLRSSPAIGIQVKAAFSLSDQGGKKKTYLSLRFRLAKKKVQNDPRLWYFFAVYDSRKLGFLDPVFLIPAHVVHRAARRGTNAKGEIWFEIQANLSPDSNDKWTPYRVGTAEVGERLLEIIDEATPTAEASSQPLPDDALVVGRWARRPAQSVRLTTTGRKYALIRNAILQRSSLVGWYQGHLRVFSPFLLGTKAGDPHVLGYQFDGTSQKVLAPDGSPENWRCLRLAELTKVQILPGVWHAAQKGKGYQHCIDQVDVSANRPSVVRRQLGRAA